MTLIAIDYDIISHKHLEHCPGGLYFAVQDISITCQTEGATIRCTTDGSTPTQTNGTI
jgi:metal-dependent hydrolase (beta-lactamase superfamily II)